MMQPPAPGTLDQRMADQLARQFNLLFNNASVYSPHHPATIRSAADFFAALERGLDLQPVITLVLEREFLYIEQWRVDTRFNAAKLITIFKKSGIQSLSFERGASADAVRSMVQILADYQTYQSVDRMKEELVRRGITAVRFNYVTYRKVTDDEAIINKDEQPGAGNPAAAKDLQIKEQVLQEFSRILSLKDLMERPDLVAKGIISASENDDTSRRRDLVDRLHILGDELRNGSIEGSPLSAQQMMEAVYRLKTELLDGIKVQKSMGRIMHGEAAVLSEVDEMTCQVIVQMVREEYRDKSVSLKRLAQIIRRMLPDVKDLKKLLPRLKEGLVADGMALADFLMLMQELDKELSGEGVLDALEEGAGDIGLSVDEIVQGIRQNPREAARLIVLAAEIKTSGKEDQFQLSRILSDYVETVSTSMTLDTVETSPSQGSQGLERIVTRIQKQLVDRLKAQGIAEDIAGRVDEQLAGRFRKTLDQLKSDWLIRIVSQGKDIDDSNLMRIIDAVVEQEIDINIVHEQLRQALVMKGYTAPRIDRFFENVRQRLSEDKTAAVALHGVLNVNNTLFFLQHQVGLGKRYGNPFSSLIITIRQIIAPAGPRPPTQGDLAQVVPGIYTTLTRQLRDLDLLGSLGTLERNVPFIILPMTIEGGAEVVRNRLCKSLDEATFTIQGESCRIGAVISICTFDKEKIPDMQAYINQAKVQHKYETSSR